MDDKVILELAGLSKKFEGENTGRGVNVLDKIDGKVVEGRFVSIMGPSGCGKTTLLKIVAGLVKASAGRVLIDGKEIIDQGDKVGMVFQEYALFPWRTTLQNIQMGLEIIGVPKKERRAAALEYIDIFDLRGFEDCYPQELSGGMQQRVAIARTLIMNPRVVLMDEPFGSLDSQTRNHLQEFLLELWKIRKETIIFVTHNVDEAVFLSDYILVLSRRPAKIIKKFEIDFPRPRDRTSRECNAIRRDILNTLREQT